MEKKFKSRMAPSVKEINIFRKSKLFSYKTWKKTIKFVATESHESTGPIEKAKQSNLIKTWIKSIRLLFLFVMFFILG